MIKTYTLTKHIYNESITNDCIVKKSFNLNCKQLSPATYFTLRLYSDFR